MVDCLMQDAVWIAIADGTGTPGTGGTTIAQVLPNPVPSTALWSTSPDHIVESWNGAFVDQVRAEYSMIGNGGHADYVGNEGYALALRAPTPGWRRFIDPTPNAVVASVDITAEQRTYPDGRARSMHNCFQVWGDGKVWMPIQNSVASGGGGTFNNACYFDRDSLGDALSPVAWTNSPGPWHMIAGDVTGGFFPDATSTKFGCAAFDRIGHKAWGLGGEGVGWTVYWSIDTLGPALGTITPYIKGQQLGSWRWAAVAHDLRIMVAGDYFIQRFTVLDLTNPSAGWTTPAYSGNGIFGGPSNAPGACYVQRNRCIAVCDPPNNGRSIYKLQIPTKVVAGHIVYDPAGTWAWTTLNPAGPPFSFGAGNSSVYTKFALIEDMGDGRSAFVYCGNYAGPTYVYKIPATGL